MREEGCEVVDDGFHEMGAAGIDPKGNGCLLVSICECLVDAFDELE